jgi:hypothetical protein
METSRNEAPYESYFSPRRNPTRVQAIAVTDQVRHLDNGGGDAGLLEPADAMLV